MRQATSKSWSTVFGAPVSLTAFRSAFRSSTCGSLVPTWSARRPTASLRSLLRLSQLANVIFDKARRIAKETVEVQPSAVPTVSPKSARF